MQLIDTEIRMQKLKQMSQKLGGLVKAVVDIKKQVMVVDAELHADEEKHLLELGSKQAHLWGINLYPELGKDQFVEFDSMINVRPRVNNYSRSVEDEKLQKKIIDIVNSLVKS